jgi:hypothetical protein
MDGHRQIDGRPERTGPTVVNDASLDREIESLLASEPSPEFLARVRGRVAREPEPGRWHASWMFAVGGVVAVLIVAVISWPSSEMTPRGDVPVEAPRVVETVEPVTPPPSVVRPRLVRRDPVRVAANAVTITRDRAIDIDLPDVMLADNEVKTFAALVTSIRQRRFDVAVPAAPDPDRPIEVEELPPVEPIEIEPIVRLAALEAEGERP